MQKRFPDTIKVFPVKRTREKSAKALKNWVSRSYLKPLSSEKTSFFPVFFPVMREIATETGSHLTASATKITLKSIT
jgi:hypothetical protein